MEQVVKKIEPVLKPLRDRVLFLKHNLNARALGALTRELAAVSDDVDALIADMQQAVGEADAYLKAMSMIKLKQMRLSERLTPSRLAAPGGSLPGGVAAVDHECGARDVCRSGASEVDGQRANIRRFAGASHRHVADERLDHVRPALVPLPVDVGHEQPRADGVDGDAMGRPVTAALP